MCIGSSNGLPVKCSLCDTFLLSPDQIQQGRKREREINVGIEVTTALSSFTQPQRGSVICSSAFYWIRHRFWTQMFYNSSLSWSGHKQPGIRSKAVHKDETLHASANLPAGASLLVLINAMCQWLFWERGKQWREFSLTVVMDNHRQQNRDRTEWTKHPTVFSKQSSVRAGWLQQGSWRRSYAWKKIARQGGDYFTSRQGNLSEKREREEDSEGGSRKTHSLNARHTSKCVAPCSNLKLTVSLVSQSVSMLTS